jgi:FKBP-type peptidyl-prolyl cis-trans isomerase
MLSCTKDDRKLALVTQEENIDKYINNLRGVRIARNGGSNRLVFTEGRGTDSLALGDSVKFYYAGYVFSNGKGPLFATNDTLVAKNNGFELSGGIEEKVLSSKDMVRGLANGLVGAKAGEKCEVVFSAKYGYDNDVVYNVPKMSPLIFEIWVEGIVKN